MFDFLRRKETAPQPSDLSAEPESGPAALEAAPDPDPELELEEPELELLVEEVTEFASTIGEDMRVGGPITTCCGLHIAGEVAGNVVCGGALLIAVGGEVRGNVDGEEDVVVRGLVRGDMTVNGTLTIAATGRVIGNVNAKAIAVEEGGELCGRCATGAPAATAATANETSSLLERMVDDDDANFSAPSLAAASA